MKFTDTILFPKQEVVSCWFDFLSDTVLQAPLNDSRTTALRGKTNADMLSRDCIAIYCKALLIHLTSVYSFISKLAVSRSSFVCKWVNIQSLTGIGNSFLRHR